MTADDLVAENWQPNLQMFESLVSQMSNQTPGKYSDVISQSQLEQYVKQDSNKQLMNILTTAN